MERYSREEIWEGLELIIDTCEEEDLRVTKQTVLRLMNTGLYHTGGVMDFPEEEYFQMIEQLTKKYDEPKIIINQSGEPRIPRRRGRPPGSKNKPKQ